MLEQKAPGRFARPLPVMSFPFVATMDVEEASADPDEPSPCLPTATSVWYALHPGRPGKVIVDLAGSTPLDPVVRLYRQVGSHPATLVFLGCASPVWNAQSSLEATIGRAETLLAQIGTSKSHEGRLVLRIELRSPPLG
jgi:hypothetical protein